MGSAAADVSTMAAARLVRIFGDMMAIVVKMHK
jgi:hypothetical protein